MGLFDKLFGSKQKISVQFINQENGSLIGASEMNPDQLPQTFAVTTTMHIQGIDWTVVEARPENSNEFIKTKKLILKLKKVEYANPNDILYSLTTISNELPTLDNHSSFKAFSLTILEDDWSQYEFLNKASLPMAEKEVLKIKAIWENNSETLNNAVIGFNNIHVRKTEGRLNLNIDFTDLTMLLDVIQIGNLKLKGNEGFVKNAFVVKSDYAIYYGIMEEQRVTQLAIHNFSPESLTETMKVARAFDLIFVNWPMGELYEK